MRPIIFAFLLGLLLSSCAPAPALTSDTPSLTPDTSPSETPVPETPTPDLATLAPDTPSPAPAISETGILTRAQKERLNRAAQSFLSHTQEEARKTAERINYVQYPDPSNMCGPLAIAQLREAGLLSRYVDPHDFWLLRPDVNAQTLARTFPADRFDHFHFKQSTREFDFNAFPLQAGDVLYLYAGKQGTFEHILTVTRVDAQGRAYSVTNLNTRPYPDYYYVIEEVMLYDPAQPGVGQFYDWTDASANSWIGLTGYGGFDVWRFAAPVQDASPEETALADKLDVIFTEAGGDWHSVILDLEAGRVVYERLSADAVHAASVIKVPIAMLLFASLEQQGIPPAELKSYLARHGNGYLLSDLLRAMLVISDENATDELLAYLRRSGLDIAAVLTKWGAPNVNVYRRTAPLDEIASLLAGLSRGDFLSPQARQIILGHMAEYTLNDDERLGVLKPLLPSGAEYYNKRGTITTERLVIGDAAILAWSSEDGKRAYVIVIFGYAGEIPTTDEKLVAGIEQAAQAFWEFAK